MGLVMRANVLDQNRLLVSAVTRSAVNSRKIFLVAVFVSSCATSVIASPVQVLSSDGSFTINYDTTQQSPAINQIQTSPGTVLVDAQTGFVGVAQTETFFDVQLNLQFLPTPGFVFVSPLSVETTKVSFTYGFAGGFFFDETTTITNLDNSPSGILTGGSTHQFGGPGGGGAIDFGLPFGSTGAPADGFNVNILATVVLFDNSSFRFGFFDFELHTVGAADTSATPIPAALPLFATGLGILGWGARRRTQKKLAA
jgi:hypothetical protein